MIIACVRTGELYGVEYVARLRDMVNRHTTEPTRFIVLTDQPRAFPGYETFLVPIELPRWWAKMVLFQDAWRDGESVLYLDLDTVVVGSLDPLAKLDVDFGICANFTRASGNLDWPCKYGSCVMKFGLGWSGQSVFDDFTDNVDDMLRRNGRYGDQMAIEELLPDATLLQTVLPDGYFLHYKNLGNNKPKKCSLVIFGGRNKPKDCRLPWIVEAWK